MKLPARIAALALCLLLCLSAAAETVFTDALGRSVHIDAPQRVIALLGSYGKVWLECGGSLCAITQDAMDSPEAAACGNVQSIGSMGNPNMVLVFSLNPDFVILSADMSGHIAIGEALDRANIPCAFFSSLDWRSYMEMVELFSSITGNASRRDALRETVQEPIESILVQAQQNPDYGRRSCLLVRADSSSVRIKRSGDVLSGAILKDMGFVNIADSNSGILESLSMEAVLLADPDWIFVVTQGSDTQAAMANLEALLTGNPAWASLRAVQEGRYAVLPKELFHLHPNRRWAESYAYIQNLLDEN